MQSKVQNFLKNVIEIKRKDLEEEKKLLPLDVILNLIQDLKIPKQVRNDNLFIKAICSPRKGPVALIAEVKFASPTNPNLGSPEELLKRVTEYEKAGADAISIITERYFFNGRLDFVYQVKKAVKIPVVQKDFVIDEYQIYQAKNVGSDAILLIAKLVNEETLKKFVDLSLKIGIEPVVEVNDEEDLKKAIATATNIIAVNARDLDTFEVDVKKARDLLREICDDYIKLGFSGIVSSKEVDLYYDAGANGVLVGTALMKADNISQFLLSLRGEDTSKVGFDSFEVKI